MCRIYHILKDNEYLWCYTVKPVSRGGASVQVWYNYYDAGSRKYLQRKGENIATIKNGLLIFIRSRTNNE